MKRVYLFKVICPLFLAACFVACKKDATTTVVDSYHAPVVAQGQVSIYAYPPKPRDYLGSGYDIMGNFLDIFSVKESVIDLKSVPDDIIIRSKLNISGSDVSRGATATEFLKYLMDINHFALPTENENELLFTGTINHGDNFPTPYEYSTQYSFACHEKKIMAVKCNLYYNEAEKLLPYLSAEFKRAIKYFSPQELVEAFGTHVLTTVYLGQRIQTLYRSVVSEKEGGMAMYALEMGLLSRQEEIYTLQKNQPTFSAKDAAKNSGGRIIVGFYGGDYEALPWHSIMVGYNEVEGGPMDIGRWKNSLDDSNMGLVSLNGEDLKPIYDFIADPLKKQQVKDAVQAHIKEKQLKVMETVPIFQASNGTHHRYFSSYQTYLEMNNASYTCYPIGSIFVNPEAGTVPLYKFSNGYNDRLSLKKDETEGMTYKGIIGYVLRESANNSWLSDFLYEIWNGSDYIYTNENMTSYGEKGSWTKTGDDFVIMKI